MVWETFKVYICRITIAKQAGVLKYLCDCLALLEKEIAQLEREHLIMPDKQLSGRIHERITCENFKYEKPDVISPDIKKYISHFPTRAPVVQELLDDSPSIKKPDVISPDIKKYISHFPNRAPVVQELLDDSPSIRYASSASSDESVVPDLALKLPEETDNATHGEDLSGDEGQHNMPIWSHGDMWGNESAVYFENTPVAFETSAPVDRGVPHSHESRAVSECITMDPNTAHPSITLAEDLRSATRLSTERHIYQDWMHFDTSACVLGSRGFTEGKHCWNVEVNAPLSSWAIGVALESVKRKDSFGLFPSDGVWVLQMEQGYLQANTVPESYLPSHSGLTRFTVCLNCEDGKVVFSNTDTETLIHTFNTPSFKEAVFPFFCLSTEGVHVKVSP
ncbi:uncharacterized protein [Pleurodeles waltl]|uniref:uncharacterized protein n=1 Tax=Pleurodeles waltl TaxID=8319 RepID=UPI00370985BA